MLGLQIVSNWHSFRKDYPIGQYVVEDDRENELRKVQ